MTWRLGYPGRPGYLGPSIMKVATGGRTRHLSRACLGLARAAARALQVTVKACGTFVSLSSTLGVARDLEIGGSRYAIIMIFLEASRKVAIS